MVASRAEAWVETGRAWDLLQRSAVASRAEAWVETLKPPSSRRNSGVASRAEAWVETYEELQNDVKWEGRLPRGGVG